MNEPLELGRILLIFTLGIPRLLAAFLLLPMFSSQVLTGMLRNGVAASLALFVFPLAAASAPAGEIAPLVGMGLLLKEALIGLLIGFGVAVLFWAVESTGFFIDNHRGATMASSIDPLTGSQTSPLGILLTQTLTVIFFVGGGFMVFLGALYESYALWPVFSFYPRLEIEAVPYLLGLFDRILGLAVLLGGPVVIAMFLAEFSLGLISRFTPQLNVFSLAMPIKSAIGVLILALYAGVLIRYLDDALLEIAGHFKALGNLL
jgi:type III secretion protein T